jgi:predicted hydrocarbon binding protein
MTIRESLLLYYPNAFGRILLMSLEEIIGHNGVNAILNKANLQKYINNYPKNNFDFGVDFSEISSMMDALESIYGPRGGRGISLRSGRICFTRSLRDYGTELGITELAFRVLPSEKKIKSIVEIFAEIFNKYSDQRVRVEYNDTHITWCIDKCPYCWGRQVNDPVCHLAVGILQEALYWVSGGKFYNVEETKCTAKGDNSCEIVINMKALE